MKPSTSSTRAVKKPLVDDKKSVRRSRDLSRERSQIKVTDKKELIKDSKSKLMRTSSNLGTKPSALSTQKITATKTVQKSVNLPPKSRPTVQQSSKVMPKKVGNESSRQKSENKLSSRMVTTKYFPPKLSSRQNSFVRNEAKKIPSESTTRRERTTRSTSDKVVKPIRSKSRTLSPSEVKILKNPSQIVNISTENIAPTKSKDIPIKKEYAPVIKAHESPPGDEYDYEDDFESYESDFEECSSSNTSSSSTSSSSSAKLDLEGSISSSSSDSEEIPMDKNTNLKETTTKVHVEEEKKMDSGNYDLRESKRAKTLNGIQEAIERENSYVKSHQERQDASLSDEGFDEKPVERAKQKNTFINFENAQILEKKLQNSKKMRKRGEDILSMISLDTLSASLLEMLPIPYEMYMLNYGRGETQQIYCQTNDDALSEEAQTDEIQLKNMWTQYPSDYVGKIRNIEDIHECNYYLNGVGGDSIPDSEQRRNYSPEKLNIFLRTSSDIMYKLLSSKNEAEACTKVRLPFSLGYRPLNTALPFLMDRPMRLLEHSNGGNTFLLTVHDSNSNDFMSADQELLARPMILIWDLLDLKEPSKLLISNDTITAACFEHSKSNLVFGGLRNGGICVWDLRENKLFHKMVKDESDNVWILRTPTFLKEPEDFVGNDIVLDEIVAIKSLVDSDHSSSSQVCSLNKRGQLIIWIVIKSNISPGQVQLVQGLAYWGKIRLSPSIVVNVNSFISSADNDLECNDLQLDSKDPNHLYISTNSGFIIHCLTLGTKVVPKLFESNTGNHSSTICVEPCPFNQPYFLVGCADGSIRLHSRSAAKSLITLYSMENQLSDTNSVKMIQWSKSRPFCIFSMDYNNIMHVWNLESSDIYPLYSIPFKDTIITTLKMLPMQNDKKTYLIMAYENGNIEIHEMSEEYSFQSSQFEQELKKFLFYVDIL